MTVAPPRPTPPFRLRAEMNGIAEAPDKVWFFELAATVIDADRCVRCGACVAACPTDSIGVNEQDLPHLVRMCTGCSLCWDFCPRGGLRYETTWLDEDPPATVPPPEQVEEWRLVGEDPAPGLGQVREACQARVRESSKYAASGAQDGGVVSAILVAALERGFIDAALVAREDPATRWRGVPYLATTSEEILASGGSFYNQTMALAGLDLDAAGLDPEARIAIVGTPCEIQGIRALQKSAWHRGASRVDAVALTIALMCTKSFDYEQLMLRLIRDERHIALERVGKVDVIHGRLIVEDHVGNVLVDEPIREFHGAALKGCDECADFLGRAADLSVGSVGSPAGFSSVLARTEIGATCFDLVRDEIEREEIARPEALLKLDALDKKIARASLQRPLEPNGPLFIEYADHLDRYGGTDREPVWRGR